MQLPFAWRAGFPRGFVLAEGHEQKGLKLNKPILNNKKTANRCNVESESG